MNPTAETQQPKPKKKRCYTAAELVATDRNSDQYKLLMRYFDFLQSRIDRGVFTYKHEDLVNAEFSPAECRKISELCTAPNTSAGLAYELPVQQANKTPQQAAKHTKKLRGQYGIKIYSDSPKPSYKFQYIKKLIEQINELHQQAAQIQ